MMHTLPSHNAEESVSAVGRTQQNFWRNFVFLALRCASQHEESYLCIVMHTMESDSRKTLPLSLKEKYLQKFRLQLGFLTISYMPAVLST